MSDPRMLAQAYGLAIEVADLGAGTGTALVSEYDAPARTIRINERALERYRQVRGELSSCDVRTFIDLAVAHELHHHREAIGEVPRLSARTAREAAADAYARTLVTADPQLDAFLLAQQSPGEARSRA